MIGRPRHVGFLAGRGRARLVRSGIVRRRGFLPGEQIFDAIDDHLWLKRFDENAVASHGARTMFVDRFESTRQQKYGNVGQLGISFDERGNFVAVLPRHPHIGEDDIRPLRLNAVDGVFAVTNRE